MRFASPRVLGARLHTVAAAVLILLLVLAQLLLSPGTSHAQPEPTEKGEKIYVTPADLGDGAKPPAPIGTAWLVGDLDTGELQVAENIDVRHAPASTIKLLTALALVDVLNDPEQKVEATFEDMEIDGTKVGLMQKNDYTVDTLFHAMLMSSANDAAHALGRAAGGQEKAVALMNEKAKSLGMTNTRAANTTGLDDPDQYTTVSDMVKLAWAVTGNERLMKIIGTQTYKFPGGTNPETKERFKGYEIQNHTKVVGQVEGGLGLKNGYTKAAKGSYIAVAERDGRRVVSALLGSENNSRQAAVDLLEWDFAQTDPETVATVPVGPAATPSPTATASGSGSDAGGTADADAAPAAESAADSALGPWGGTLPFVLLGGGVLLLVAAVLLWVRLRKRHRTLQ
ncbi:D-alanyl-D-alanine carboxypeptidase family protein [Brevibacterium casei]|uniref:D-alanyl-D-alanine carboxypeptidase family protein n=1 Tax=Brevibacterium casei TaxID=33889 RepID=UPI0036F5AC32